MVEFGVWFVLTILIMVIALWIAEIKQGGGW